MLLLLLLLLWGLLLRGPLILVLRLLELLSLCLGLGLGRSLGLSSNRLLLPLTLLLLYLRLLDIVVGVAPRTPYVQRNSHLIKHSNPTDSALKVFELWPGDLLATVAHKGLVDVVNNLQDLAVAAASAIGRTLWGHIWSSSGEGRPYEFIDWLQAEVKKSPRGSRAIVIPIRVPLGLVHVDY